MAKSPVGGSRAYLKGRIGSDVYSLGKDGKGKRQQVVRALAEQVSNPRSESQMVGRMIMSTVMQAAKTLGAIIDHSFDNVPVGQPSVSEFIRRNYAILKDGAGIYNAYQEKGAKENAYVVSQGKAQWPSGTLVGQNENSEGTAFGMWGVTLPVLPKGSTVGDVRAMLQVGSAEDYITIIGGEDFKIVRFQVNPNLSDDTPLYDYDTTDPVENLFVVDEVRGQAFEQINAYNESGADKEEVWIGIKVAYLDATNFGAIISKKVNGKWQHSACQLHAITSGTPNYSTALATYPTGAEMFLNGGEL